jgi:hypothetical protein
MGAARVAGVAVCTTVYWRKNNPWFRERFQEAEQAYRDFLQDMVHTRVVRGTEQPIVGKRWNAEAGCLEDDIIGMKTLYSENLTMFHVKRHIPQYRDNYQPPPEQETVRGSITALDRITRRLNEKAARRVIDVSATAPSDKVRQVSDTTGQEDNTTEQTDD